MIIKHAEERSVQDPRVKAGVHAERQMAHYLDRQFASSDKFLVLHDLRFTHDGEVAQIDHLVVHPFGVAIVESKSVSEAVRINAQGEWERRWRGVWQGMPDPLLQGERQATLLKRLLRSREPELLDKFLLGTLQGTFGYMALDVFAAISDGGRIIRTGKGQAPNAKKADAIPGAIVSAVEQHRRASRLLGSNLAAFVNAPRDFSKAETMRIARFLHAHHRALNDEEPVRHAAEPAPPQSICKYCGSSEVQPLTGRYGPYVKCSGCGKNTSLKGLD